MSSFGLIEENVELSHIHLPVRISKQAQNERGSKPAHTKAWLTNVFYYKEVHDIGSEKIKWRLLENMVSKTYYECLSKGE